MAHENWKKKEVHILLFMDFVCEWCYLGKKILDGLHEHYDFDVNYMFMEIHPDTPETGMPMKLHLHFPERFYALLNRLGMPYQIHFCDREVFSNTHQALLLGEVARQSGKAEAYVNALWDAYMVEGKNISDKRILAEIALSVGLSPQDADKPRYDGSYQASLTRNERLSQTYGAQGQVPAFIVNNEYILTGAQSAETWIELFKTINTERP
jgi:predicted DsbA family dithiol-disulfide isomerase